MQSFTPTLTSSPLGVESESLIQVTHTIRRSKSIKKALTSSTSSPTSTYFHLRASARHSYLELFWSTILFFGGFVLDLVNYILYNWAPWYQLNYHMTGKCFVGGDVAVDGVSPPNTHVDVALNVFKFGNLENETMDIIQPKECAVSGVKAKKEFLYVHGGGWMAANAACLIHSLSPMARAGFKVFCMDYPLAPKHRFPTPLISVLRALNDLKRNRGVAELFVMGDSAGGNLVTMAISLVYNRELLLSLCEELSKEEREEVLAFEYPKILGMTSVYGILDQKAWASHSLDTISTFEAAVVRFCYAFAHRAYESKTNVFGNKFTMMDIVDQINHLPPLQLVCGTKDPLVHSNKLGYRVLKEKGFEVSMHLYAGRHASLGFPPAWLSEETFEETKPAIQKIISFANSLY
eukprot:Awhi_evm1s698